MDRAERSAETLRKLGQAVLPPGVEQQRGEDVGLQLGPEHRQQRRGRTSHKLMISTDYPKCQGRNNVRVQRGGRWRSVGALTLCCGRWRRRAAAVEDHGPQRLPRCVSPISPAVGLMQAVPCLVVMAGEDLALLGFGPGRR